MYLSQMHLHFFGLNRRHSETLLLMVGQLVLIAYIFQVAALDHWTTNLADVSGVVGTSQHTTLHHDHCHGDAGSCADSGTAYAQISVYQMASLPSSRPSFAIETDLSTALPKDAFVASLPHPPRQAA
jgi:hypothetical protein